MKNHSCIIGKEYSVIFKSKNDDWTHFNGIRINCKVTQILDNVAMVVPYCCGHEHLFYIKDLLPYKSVKRK